MNSISSLLFKIGLFPILIAAGVTAAHATILSGDITIALNAPGGLTLDSTPIATTPVTLPVADGILISAGDGTEIGTNMLTGETIGLTGNSILISSYSGGMDGNGNEVTGYLGSGADHANYTFTGLTIPGQTIVGLTVSGVDFGAPFDVNPGPSGYIGASSPAPLDSLVHLTSPGSFTVDLDTLIFKDRGLGQSYDHVDLTIGLITTPVPEPATWGLLASGVLLLWSVRRKQDGYSLPR